MTFYPLLFRPNLHTVVWGGHQLQPYKGLPATDDPIGESWEVSAVPSSTSIISNGPLAGRDLVSVINEAPDAILGHAVNEKYQGQLPLLVKFIDAQRDLSIQVHPNDEMAQREHGKMGKSEMWYVIKATPDAHLYAGFKQRITPYAVMRAPPPATIRHSKAQPIIAILFNPRFIEGVLEKSTEVKNANTPARPSTVLNKNKLPTSKIAVMIVHILYLRHLNR